MDSSAFNHIQITEGLVVAVCFIALIGAVLGVCIWELFGWIAS